MSASWPHVSKPSERFFSKPSINSLFLSLFLSFFRFISLSLFLSLSFSLSLSFFLSLYLLSFFLSLSLFLSFFLSPFISSSLSFFPFQVQTGNILKFSGQGLNRRYSCQPQPSNEGSEQHLRPTPQLLATQDPQLIE